jgi:hypothetical protein
MIQSREDVISSKSKPWEKLETLTNFLFGESE